MAEEYAFKNGFKVFVPEDITKENQEKMIDEWATVTMYMSVFLHPPQTMKKVRKPYTWKTDAKWKTKGMTK